MDCIFATITGISKIETVSNDQPNRSL